jgi:hypothetical protein
VKDEEDGDKESRFRISLLAKGWTRHAYAQECTASDQVLSNPLNEVATSHRKRPSVDNELPAACIKLGTLTLAAFDVTGSRFAFHVRLPSLSSELMVRAGCVRDPPFTDTPTAGLDGLRPGAHYSGGRVDPETDIACVRPPQSVA